MQFIKADTSGLLAPHQLYRALGVWSEHHHEPRYIIAVPGEIRSYRAQEMIGLQFLFALCPDAEHWRESYRTGQWRGGSIDTLRAAADIIGACSRAGEYPVPLELRPRPVGRPWPKREPLTGSSG